MWDEIARLAAVEQLTVLLTTHYLDEADQLADRLAIVDHGRLVVEGTPDELKGRLNGDGVVVEVVDQTAATVAAERLSHLDGLNDVTHEGRVVRARTRSAAGVIPSVLASLDQAGVEVASATVSRPSLDDVYLHYAGRTFEVEVEPRGYGGRSPGFSRWSHGDTGRSPGSPKEPTDDRSPHPLRAADPPVADRVGAATGIPAHHPHPADDLAAAVRRSCSPRSSRSPGSPARGSRSSPSSPPVSS